MISRYISPTKLQVQKDMLLPNLVVSRICYKLAIVVWRHERTTSGVSRKADVKTTLG